MENTDKVSRGQVKERYEALDGLRGYSAIGIVLMHVLGNGAYEIGGFVFESLIMSMADLVFLFMVISGFSLCCGYYEKMVSGKLSLGRFYGKRFARVWPFFALLCVLDFAISPSANALYETLANLTLCFGLIPNHHISVIGVGWFLGLVFVFYFLFPFMCYLLSERKRAWLSFAVALVLNILCTVRFDVGRETIVYSGVYFMAGGMIYLYRQPLRKFADRFGWCILLGIAAVLAAYYFWNKNTAVMLLCTVPVVIYALKTPRRPFSFLRNPVAKKLGELSMEIYLSHMVIFRVLEKVGLARLFPSSGLSFAVAFVVTLTGTVIFAVTVKKLLSVLIDRLGRKK